MLIGNNWLTKAERDDRKKIGIAIAATGGSGQAVIILLKLAV